MTLPVGVDDRGVVEERRPIIRVLRDQRREGGEGQRRSDESRAIAIQELAQHLAIVERADELEHLLVAKQEGHLEIHEDLVARVQGPQQVTADVGVVHHRAADVEAVEKTDDAMGQGLEGQGVGAGEVGIEVQQERNRRRQQQHRQRRRQRSRPSLPAFGGATRRYQTLGLDEGQSEERELVGEAQPLGEQEETAQQHQ